MKLDLEHLLKEQKSTYGLIRRISAVAGERSLQTFLVGGFVRDLLLKKKNKDIDIVVTGDGLKFADAVSEALHVFPVVKYREFGTAMIPLDGMELEIATARKEVYKPDSRNPEVEATDLDEDLRRRDFTINTMAICINRERFGEFTDPFHGMRDLKERRIVTPMDPEATFFEDPLRMLRALRFAAQLDFHIEASTFVAIREYAGRIHIVSRERIRDEFLKIIGSDEPSRGILLMEKSGLLGEIFPGIPEMRGVDAVNGRRHKDVFFHTLKVLENIASVTDDPDLRLAALFHDIAKPATKRYLPKAGWTFHGHEEMGAQMFEGIGRDLRLPSRNIKRIAKLIRLHLRPIAIAKDEVTDSAVRRLMVEAGDDIDDLLLLCRADITSKNRERVKRYRSNFEKVAERIGEVEEKDKLRAFQSPLDGNAIMKMFGLKPGPEVGRIKHHIEEAILDGEIGNNYAEAKQFAEKNKEKLIDLYLRNR